MKKKFLFISASIFMFWSSLSLANHTGAINDSVDLNTAISLIQFVQDHIRDSSLKNSLQEAQGLIRRAQSGMDHEVNRTYWLCHMRSVTNNQWTYEATGESRKEGIFNVVSECVKARGGPFLCPEPERRPELFQCFEKSIE